MANCNEKFFADIQVWRKTMMMPAAFFEERVITQMILLKYYEQNFACVYYNIGNDVQGNTQRNPWNTGIHLSRREGIAGHVLVMGNLILQVKKML